MDSKLVASEKIKLGKKFKFAWIVVFVALTIAAVSFLPDYVEYRNYLLEYRKGMERAVELYAERTGKDLEGDLKSVVDDLFEQYAGPITISGENGELLRRYIEKVNTWVGEKLSEEGFECRYGTEYLIYIEILPFWHFALLKFEAMYYMPFAAPVFLLVFNLWYAINIKNIMIIENDKIICKKKDKTIREFFIKDIKTVDRAPLKGLLIRGSGFIYHINLLANAENLKATIIESLTSIQNKSKDALNEIKEKIQPSSADELIKFKELLDMGVISQDEFEMKKKQLLSK